MTSNPEKNPLPFTINRKHFLFPKLLTCGGKRISESTGKHLIIFVSVVIQQTTGVAYQNMQF